MASMILTSEALLRVTSSGKTCERRPNLVYFASTKKKVPPPSFSPHIPRLHTPPSTAENQDSFHTSNTTSLNHPGIPPSTPQRYDAGAMASASAWPNPELPPPLLPVPSVPLPTALPTVLAAAPLPGAASAFGAICTYVRNQSVRARGGVEGGW